jgi:uncharacterized protein with HEPN domain
MILSRIESHGVTADNYPVSAEYQDLLTMPTLRICEIIAKFTEELTVLNQNYNWAAAAKMRNQIAHPYGGFDSSFVWDAAQSDIPELLIVCNSILNTD